MLTLEATSARVSPSKRTRSQVDPRSREYTTTPSKKLRPASTQSVELPKSAPRKESEAMPARTKPHTLSKVVPVGKLVGWVDGWAVGDTEGTLDGCALGCTLGTAEGCAEGTAEGWLVGSLEGEVVGCPEGFAEGCVDGWELGDTVGTALG